MRAGILIERQALGLRSVSHTVWEATRLPAKGEKA